MSSNESRIILAADGLNLNQCLDLAAKVQKKVYAIKIHDLYDRYGFTGITSLKRAGTHKVWVDLKLHDIPNTVKIRARALAENGADIITVHASGGVDMMQAAIEGAGPHVKVYAVTALTSLSPAEITHIYGSVEVRVLVNYLAELASLSGVHGIVCSPKEVDLFDNKPRFHGMDLIVPGVRSPGQDVGDQKRVDTPLSAIKAGATYLVIGRQITLDEDPIRAIELIEEEISSTR